MAKKIVRKRTAPKEMAPLPRKQTRQKSRPLPVRKPMEPYFASANSDWDPDEKLRWKQSQNPLTRGTLGDIGLGIRVNGPEEFSLTVLIQPFDPLKLKGFDISTIRNFRWNDKAGILEPVWNSGVNTQLGFIWTKVRHPGVYVPLALPRDRILQEALRMAARERRVVDAISEGETNEITQQALRLFLEVPEEALAEARELIMRIEVQTGLANFLPGELKMREGGHYDAFPLPKDESPDAFRKRLQKLETPAGGLPEEALFYPPDTPMYGEPPWVPSPEHSPWWGIDWRHLENLELWRYVDIVALWPWLFSNDWWMYQHDQRHTGHASGASDIRSTTVSGLVKQPHVAVDGPVITKPSIVDGKIYIGTGKQGGTGGTLYKIDLATGNIDGKFPTAGDGTAFYTWVSGIGGSPAIVNGKVYMTGVHGKVYCIEAATMTASPPHPYPLWVTDLRSPSMTRNQPVNNPSADSWSGPLVVNGRVYVGCGEGESATTYGFVFCLNAETGHVEWLFCTSKFSGTAHNNPNTIPTAVAASWAATAGFSVVANPPETGSAVWSSCAYDATLNRIYVGTGNSQYPQTALPDQFYGSGLLCLDATTGAFKGFFQPTPDDSYWPGDCDIDVPGSPTVFTHNGTRVVAFGSKNGSFFLIDPDDHGTGTLTALAKRQLLPRAWGTGVPGDRGTGIDSVVPTGGIGENMYGVMATPALHTGLGTIFVGVGGYNGMALDTVGIDQTRTPFLRAVDWNNLLDKWPVTVGPDGVGRYLGSNPPMYLSTEAGLSSPAVVHDVVFVSTSKPAMYALDAATGACLWMAPGISGGQFALGPAIYGNYVVLGVGNKVYIYKYGYSWLKPLRELLIDPWWLIHHKWPIPPPPPPPDPFLRDEPPVIGPMGG
jgi:outer membrane protein assembly factor BamB